MSPHRPGQHDKRTDRAGKRGRIQTSFRFHGGTAAAQPAAESRPMETQWRGARKHPSVGQNGGGGAAATRQRDMVSSPRYDMWSPDHSALAGPRHPPQTRLGCPRSRGSSSQAPSRWGERPRGEQWGASENKPRVLRPALWPHLTGGARWGGSKGPLPGGGEQKTRKGLSHLQSDTRYI